jgi:hypothetical protein
VRRDNADEKKATRLPAMRGCPLLEINEVTDLLAPAALRCFVLLLVVIGWAQSFFPYDFYLFATYEACVIDLSEFNERLI